MVTDTGTPWESDKVYTKYTLWFIYACIIYSIIGFTWGALMGGIADFRYFVDHRMHGNLIVCAHTHINLLGWAPVFYAVHDEGVSFLIKQKGFIPQQGQIGR